MARAKRTDRAEARRRYRATVATDTRRGRSTAPMTVRRRLSRRQASERCAARQGRDERHARADRLRRRLPSCRSARQRPAGPRLPAVDRAPHEGALAAGPDHDRQHDRSSAVDRRERHGRPACCSPTSSRRPAIGGVFIAGFLAPRASWLARRRSSASCRRSATSRLARHGPAAAAVQRAMHADADRRDVVISAFIFSPIIGAFFAAAAAWYRRFLALSSPNRSRRQSQAQKQQRPGRRPDAQQRATSQKAPAKR